MDWSITRRSACITLGSTVSVTCSQENICMYPRSYRFPYSFPMGTMFLHIQHSLLVQQYACWAAQNISVRHCPFNASFCIKKMYCVNTANVVTVLTKFLPCEQPAPSAKGKPSKLHKRKHQIGSLYFDMKSKEMELAERRSKGILTKAETQAKYGWWTCKKTQDT